MKNTFQETLDVILNEAVTDKKRLKIQDDLAQRFVNTFMTKSSDKRNPRPKLTGVKSITEFSVKLTQPPLERRFDVFEFRMVGKVTADQGTYTVRAYSKSYEAKYLLGAKPTILQDLTGIGLAKRIANELKLDIPYIRKKIIEISKNKK